MTSYLSLCLLLSSSLLLLVQPMVARMLLPTLGGSPSVWNTCMVFFQAGLLAGYAYAHFGPRWLGVRGHAAVHGLLLCATFVALPIEIPPPASPPEWPALWVLKTLAVSVGLPYVLLASTSTLVQLWFARCTRRDPYFLYAASNIGSLLGLLAYPIVVEPTLTLARQAQGWRIGFAALIALIVAAAGRVWMSVDVAESGGSDGSQACPTPRIVIRWILLALAPSSLLLSVTNHLTTDLASTPMLWVVPLAIYLLTFVAAFARRPWLSRRILVRNVPIVILFLIFFWFSEATSPLIVIVAAHLAGFAWLAFFCHGELAATRPTVAHLSEFYFWIALGGVLGGVLNVLVAPLVFTAHLEYPLILVVIGFLRPDDGASPRSQFAWALGIGAAAWLFVYCGSLVDLPAGPIFLMTLVAPLMATLFVRNSTAYAAAVVLILSTTAIYPSVHGETLERRRSFFGVHRVARSDGLFKLIHGNTVHGIQASATPREPLAYYHRGSPIGDVVQRMDGKLKSVGVVGLGSGALAAYAESRQTWTFFEIDPDVEILARRHFSYLADSRADVRVVLGDARLTLTQSPERFDLLVIDAFGSDSIPTHLLTREALDLYAAHLNSGGVVAFHVSNRHVDLFPVLAAMAEFGWSGAVSDPAAWPSNEKDGKLASWWAILSRDPATITALRGERSMKWTPLSASRKVEPWTDDFVNLGAVIRWDELFRNE